MGSDASSAAHYAIAVIDDRLGRILLLKRAPGQRLGAGLWGFPGGHIHEEETPDACIVRELAEELGREHQLELLGRMGPVCDAHYGGRMRVHLFHFRWLGGRIRLNDEHTEFTWVGPGAYRDYAVMDGIDDDLAYFDIWPRHVLNPAKLTV